MRHVIGAWSDRLSTQTPRQQTIEAAYSLCGHERREERMDFGYKKRILPEARSLPGTGRCKKTRAMD
jgi:hypothetical protein